MPGTYFLTGTASDLGGGANFSNALSQTAPAASSVAISVTTNTAETDRAFTPAGEPGATGGSGAQDYTVTVVIDTANADLQLSVQLHRINSDGTIQTSSTASAEQGFTGGPLTFGFTGLDLGTFAAGDRLRVDFIQRDTTIHGDEAAAYTISNAGTRIDVPFAVESPSVSPSASASPSSSASPSKSPSASVSPSSSASPSTSPSASKSPSASQSPSASASPSISPSASISPSVSPSSSVSPSPSASPSPSEAITAAHPINNLMFVQSSGLSVVMERKK